MKKVLILSAYDGLSHRFWREGLARYLTEQGGWQVTSAVLPPRFFSWRQRGSSLSFSQRPEVQGDFDLLIATSMTDVSGLFGLNRRLASVPTIVYFHENQFAYPENSEQGRLERQLTSIYTGIAADSIVFNSRFNQLTYLAGAADLLAKMPDEVPAGIVASLEQKSRVVPVGLDVEPATQYSAPEATAPLRIVWNHRHEFDKGPARLQAITEGLLAAGSNFRLSLLGESFRRAPAAFAELAGSLTEQGVAGHLGFVNKRTDYLNVLRDHHVVLSTADQEFQGLAVQEAMAMGCRPVVPDALSYPEYVDSSLRYGSTDEAIGLILRGQTATSPAAALRPYHWDIVGPAWLAVTAELVP